MNVFYKFLKIFFYRFYKRKINKMLLLNIFLKLYSKKMIKSSF